MISHFLSKRIVFLLLIFLLMSQTGIGLNAQAKADDVGVKPQGQVILTISGEIEHGSPAGVAEFDLDALKALETVDIETETPWTDGKIRFTGVLARDVLDLVGAKGNAISAMALNDYSVTIPFTDFETYDVIIAIERDGAPMRIRDRGPLWVIYPWSDNAELRNELYYSRSIWQLRSIKVLD